MKKKMIIERTKKGFPALWESGGGYTNTGEALIVADAQGKPKKPIYVRRRGHLANAAHALFVVEKGDIIVDCNHHREDFEGGVYKIVDFLEEDGYEYAVLERLHYHSKGEWDTEPLEKYQDAIDASAEKATCYHCREPHYILE